MADTCHIVVMGVSGVGKSEIAEALARELHLEMTEGDTFHTETSIAKMSSGQAMTDEDRWPWLEALAEWTRERRTAGRSTVVTCSALRKVYRDVLRGADPRTFFVFLCGDEALLRQRMKGREHFMPVSLLHSQFEALEPLEPDELGVAVDVAGSVDQIVGAALAALPTGRCVERGPS